MWKQIQDLHYEVNRNGQIRNSQNNHILKPIVNKRGYCRFYYLKNGKMKSLGYHRIVAEAFLPKIVGKEVVNHKDLNKQNNTDTNLEWCTSKENSRHAIDNGAFYIPRGDGHGGHKLTSKQVINIRHCRGSATCVLLAKLYNVDKSSICNVWRRKTWKHI